MHSRYYNQSTRIKTERALESINHSEQINEHFRSKIQKFKEEIFTKQNYKIIQEGQWNRIQLESGTSQLYELMNSKNKGINGHVTVQLKIIIKHFTGTAIHLAISSKPELTNIKICDHKIAGEKIVKYKNPIFLGNKVYLTLHSPADLNLFKLKYEFVQAGEELQSSRLKSSSLKLIKLKDIHDKIQSYDKEESILNLKRAVSPRTLILDKSRIETARVQSIEKEKQRLSMAKQKRYHLEAFREKSKSLRAISKDCVTILNEYKSHVGQRKQRNQKLMKNLLLTLFTVNFVGTVGRAAKERDDGLKKATNMSLIMKKCSNRVMNMVRQLKSIEPRRDRRQMLAIYHSTAVLTKLMFKKDTSKAQKVVVNCLNEIHIAMGLNSLLNHAAVYRSKIRNLQRYWLGRNKAQIKMFKHFIEVQSGIFLTKFMYFGLARDDFYNRNMSFNLAWQYLKESSLKLNVIIQAHKARLEEIQQMKKMNIEIKEHNSKALKKNQKKYFDIPNIPPKPVTKYFRDIGILKGMLRSWYEIEYRKMVKKMKKEGQEVPQQKSKSKNKK